MREAGARINRNKYNKLGYWYTKQKPIIVSRALLSTGTWKVSYCDSAFPTQSSAMAAAKRLAQNPTKEERKAIDRGEFVDN